MASADEILSILVKTDGDPSGANTATTALEKTNASVKNAGKASEEAGRGAEKHAAGLHAIHRLCHALNEVVPGLGALMQAAFSPIGAAISLAIMALRAFHEKIKEVNAELQRMEEEAAKPSTHRLEALRDATVQAAVGMAQLDFRLAQAARGEQTLAEKTQAAISVAKQQASQALTLAAAIKENEIANLETAHARGIVSEEFYSAQKLKIEADYIKAKAKLEEDAARREIQIKEATLAEAKAAQPGLEQTAAAAELARVKAAEDLAALAPRAEIDKRHEETQKALKAAESAMPKATLEFYERLRTGQITPEMAANMKDAGRTVADYQAFPDYKRWVEARQKAATSEAEWAGAPAAEARRKVAADATARDADRAAKKVEENEDYIAKTHRDLGFANAEYTARLQGNDKVVGLQTGALAMKGPMGAAATGDVQAAIGAAQAFEQHKAVTQESKQKLTDIASAIAGHAVSLKTAVQMMDWAAKNFENFTTTTERLLTAMTQIAQSGRLAGARLSSLEMEVKQLQAQLANTHNQ